MQAFYLSEAGLDSALGWLRGWTSPPVPYNSGAVNLGAGSFNFIVTSAGALSYKIACTGTVEGVARTLSAVFSEDHYSRYAYFTNSELYQSSSVWFVDWDVLKGHSAERCSFASFGAAFFGRRAERERSAWHKAQ
ncbi:MAG: hypothetical protein AABY43_06065 [Candidatus Omnitrophota bacterium]